MLLYPFKVSTIFSERYKHTAAAHMSCEHHVSTSLFYQILIAVPDNTRWPIHGFTLPFMSSGNLLALGMNTASQPLLSGYDSPGWGS